MTSTLTRFVLHVLMATTAVYHLPVLVHALPIETGDPMDDLIGYGDLKAAMQNLMLSNLASDSAGSAFNDLRLPRPLYRGTPTDTPTIRDLMRSAVQEEMERLSGRNSNNDFRVRKGGQLLKRSFDSISRGSGFGGMHRGSWGGGSRGGENLTFTFESLFPAIARGLRSSAK